jgi:hypothetical protein
LLVPDCYGCHFENIAYKKKGFAIMPYEYKVISLAPFCLDTDPEFKDKRFIMNGWAPAEETEEAINNLAEEGWEYLHPIVIPYTTNGEYICHTVVRLVFRREKA